MIIPNKLIDLYLTFYKGQIKMALFSGISSEMQGPG